MSREVMKTVLEALGKAKRQIVHANVAPHGCIAEAIADLREALAQPEEQQSCDRPEQMARLGWQYFECPVCGSEGARAFPKPEEQQSCDKQEPVEYQMRMRPTWEATSWSDWKKCSRDAAGDYAKTPKLHDWEYETRKLYAQPITQAIPQIPQIPQKDSSNEKRNNFLNGYCVGQADLLAEQAKQEPAAWMVYTQDGQSVYVTDNPTDIQKGQRALPLYTSPPQRQPLTDEEIAEVAERMEATDAASSFWRDYARAIEAKLKEKNT